MQARLIIVNEDGRRYMHCRNQSEAFLDSAFTQSDLYIRRNILETTPTRNIEPKFFTIGFQVSPHLTVVKMPIVEPIEARQSKVDRAVWGFPNGMVEP